MECCRSPELLLLLRLSSASNCQLHSSMTVTASHVRRSFNVFCNWSYVSETRLMLQCLTTHSLTSGAPPALSATRAMFLKQDPCCRRKTFTTEPFFFFLKQKVYCRNLLKQDTRCRKKNLHYRIVFLFLKLVLCCKNLLKQDPYCRKKTGCAGLTCGQREHLIRIDPTATQAADAARASAG